MGSVSAWAMTTYRGEGEGGCGRSEAAGYGNHRGGGEGFLRMVYGYYCIIHENALHLLE